MRFLFPYFKTLTGMLFAAFLIASIGSCSKPEVGDKILNPNEIRDGIVFAKFDEKLTPLGAADWSQIKILLDRHSLYVPREVLKLSDAMVDVTMEKRDELSRGIRVRVEKKDGIWRETLTEDVTTIVN